MGGTFPNVSNTGVPQGVALTPSGSITVTTNGAVIDGKDVTGCIKVRASNVTIKNTRVRFTGGCANEIIRLDSGTNLVVQDSGSTGNVALTAARPLATRTAHRALRLNMHSCSDGPRVSGSANVVVRDSWVHNLSSLSGDHGDGIQCYQGRGSMTVQHNTLDARGTAINAAFFTADYCSGIPRCWTATCCWAGAPRSRCSRTRPR